MHWTCSSSVQHYCPFFIYFLLCMSSLSICAILLTVFDFSTYVVNKHLIILFIGLFSCIAASLFNKLAYLLACSLQL